MAFPTIVFNASTGSDTEASGAGPATAVFGTKAQTRNEAGSLHVGFFEGTPPDLSGVATDGSAALYINTASGRKFAQIVGVKDTQQSGNDAAINSGNNQVTVGDTTGISVDDVIMISGAGTAGADFYQRVSAVNSGTLLTLYSSAATTVSGANWVCPKKVQLQSNQGVNSAGSDLAWAIGGKRATFDEANSRTLFGTTGVGNGWIIETETDQSITSTELALAATTDYTLRGASSTERTITQSANAACVGITGAGKIELAYLKFANTNGTKTSAVGVRFAASCKLYIRDCTLGDPTNTIIAGLYRAFGTPIISVARCLFQNMSSNAVETLFSPQIFYACRFKTITGDAIRFSRSDPLVCEYCIFDDITGDGIRSADGNGGNATRRIVGNIFYECADGIDVSAWSTPSTELNMVIENNIFALCSGRGIRGNSNFTGSLVQQRNNAFYSNTSGDTANMPAAENDISLTNDPFVDAANGDFNINSAAGGGAALRATEIAIP